MAWMPLYGLLSAFTPTRFHGAIKMPKIPSIEELQAQGMDLGSAIEEHVRVATESGPEAMLQLHQSSLVSLDRKEKELGSALLFALNSVHGKPYQYAAIIDIHDHHEACKRIFDDWRAAALREIDKIRRDHGLVADSAHTSEDRST